MGAVAADCFELFIRRPAERDLSTINNFYLVKNESVQIPQGYHEFLSRARLDSVSEPWRVRPDGFQKPIPDSTGDPEVAKVALEWLQSCLGLHGSCSSNLTNQNLATYPKRLIKVGGSTPRLIVAEDESPDGCYATLSHCWGKDPTFFTLTQSRLHILKHELPLNDLPQTFQDAITLARRLNIPYLWIDSLCIIQDSKQDWLEHAQTMASIYEGCVLNISVDHASSPCAGIFKPRDTSQVQESHILWAAPGERETVWTIFDPDVDTFHGRKLRPLQRRAWVFQERLLAPRVLHFGETVLSWECKTNPCSCEASPKISQPWGLSPYQKVFSIVSDPPLHLTRESIAEYHSRLRQQFQTLISYYSQMELTKPDEDKLVAFSGIAKRIGSTDYYNHQYFAGLFLKDLLVNLVWANISSKVTKTSQEIYRAPTWSWASLDSHVKTFPWQQQISNLAMLAEIRSISVSYVDPNNRYGQIKAAHLVLLGSLIPCRIGSFTMQHCHFRADLLDEAEPGDLIGDFRPDMREGVSYEGRSFACPIVRDPTPDTGQIRGIVLQTTEDGMFYERLGFFASGPGWPGAPGEMGHIIDLAERQVITIV